LHIVLSRLGFGKGRDHLFGRGGGGFMSQRMRSTATGVQLSPQSGSAAPCRRGSTLVCRNVMVGGRRTSLRLERLMWEALAEICRREGLSRSDICSRVEARRRESSLTAAVRVYILSYFRAAATEEGHADAGHGPLA
jgi:predicted DNA-binding ribbon-helix-helix protein